MKTARPNARLIAGAGLFVVVALLPALSRAHGDEGHSHGEPAHSHARETDGVVTVSIETQFLIGLRTRRVARGTIAESIGVAGHINTRPDGDARVAAPLAGRVVPPPGGFPRLGDMVRRGQVLAQLEQTVGASEAASIATAQQTTALARSEARARLTQAQSRLALAEQNAARVRRLQGVVSAREIAAAQTDVEVARAEIERARRDVGMPGVSGGRTVVLRAPLDGTVVLAEAQGGSQVAQGAELFRVADLSRLWIDVRLSESQAATMSPADTAVVTSVVDPSLRVEARRVAVSALIDEATRTVQAIFEVPNPDGRLRIGAAVEVGVRGREPVTAIEVPEAALLQREGATVVVVKTGAESFEVRTVRTGPRGAGSVGVLTGLSPGERVVVEGASSVLLAAQ